MSNELHDHRVCAECGNPEHQLTFLGDDGPYCTPCATRYRAEDAAVVESAVAKLGELRYVMSRQIHEVEHLLTHGNPPPALESAYQARLEVWMRVKEVLDR